MKPKYNTTLIAWTLGAYYLTIALFLAGALFPEGRVWGISVYAGLPDALVRNAFIVAALAPLLYFWLLYRHFAAPPTPRARKFRRFVSLAFVALAITVFTLFRAQTHFGGDGYTLLGLLAADNPLLKSREIGESLLHLWLKHLRGGDAQTAALFSYQFISIGAGALFVGAALYSAHRLFADSLWRALFALGLCSGGYMLLYFGYVENYSVLVLTVSVFATLGVLSLRGAFSRWWLALVAALALWLHLLAAFVAPALAYGLLAGTSWGRAFGRKSRGFHWALATAALVGGVALLAYLYQQSMFFQLALLLPWETTFTIDGYTLFAADHLIDFANLAALLAPWSALVVPLILITRGAEAPELAVRREYRFLAILAVSALIAVCVLDPKLGMPRDWDLFAFAGPPAAALFFVATLRDPNRGFERALLALCAATLGFFTLAPRVATQLYPSVAADKFADHLALDPGRSRTGVQVLQDFYLDAADTSAADAVLEGYYERYPEVTLNRLGQRLRDVGARDSAMAKFREAMQAAPDFAPAYLNLGREYLVKEAYDSAAKYLRIADGLNPYNPETLSALALLDFKLGRFENAWDRWLKVVERDTPPLSTLVGLVQLSSKFGRPIEYERYLSRLAHRTDAPPGYAKALGDYYLQARRIPEAHTAYLNAVRQGHDSTLLEQFYEQYPEYRP